MQSRQLIPGRIAIAAVESVAGEFLPSTIAEYQSKYEDITFHVTIGVPKDLLAALIQDRADLILTHDATRHRYLNIVTIVHQALCALVVPGHPLSTRKELHLDDCRGYPIALGDSTLAGRGLIEQGLAKGSSRFEPALISNSIETMKAFSRIRGGVCFQFAVPGIAHGYAGDMVAIPLSDISLAQAQLVLATRQERPLPPDSAAFLDYIKMHLELKFPERPR